jgi:hypothetical protein
MAHAIYIPMGLFCSHDHVSEYLAINQTDFKWGLNRRAKSLDEFERGGHISTEGIKRCTLAHYPKALGIGLVSQGF